MHSTRQNHDRQDCNGESYHNLGLAVDVIEIKDGKALWENPNWTKIGELGESLGFTWGGRWKRKDLPHFQATIKE